jgi:hypothetical protein
LKAVLKALSGGFLDTLDGERAFAGHHRSAFDAGMAGILDAPGRAHVEAAGHTAAEPQQREHIRERVHGLPERSPTNFERNSIDRITAFP